VPAQATTGSTGPFDGQELTGADVFWLAVRELAGQGGGLAGAENRLQDAIANSLLRVSLDLSGIDLRGAILSGAHLEDATLGKAHLEGAVLGVAHLERAFLGGAHLEGAFLDRALLMEANLGSANLERASLWAANLRRASLYGAHLEDAVLPLAILREVDLRSAHLERADLREVYLQRANLTGAFLNDASLYESALQGTVFTDANMSGCDLRRATLSGTTRLNSADLDGVSLDQVELGRTNLAVVTWSEVSKLGDDVVARERRHRTLRYSMEGKRKASWDKRKHAAERRMEYLAAGRAYRSLSILLHEQGLTRNATRFHYRGEVMSRRAVYFNMLDRATSLRFYEVPYLFVWWLLSLVLGLVAGYGVYHVWRLAVTYAVIVGAFAGVYAFLGGHAITPLNALVLSLTSFHGRGLQPSITASGPMSVCAAVEAVLGLLVEALFIAAFTRRVTGS
jgi:uncharacterized protein YjbI with pentapeptide repeats